LAGKTWWTAGKPSTRSSRQDQLLIWMQVYQLK
jgi:hypothetical protein